MGNQILLRSHIVPLKPQIKIPHYSRSEEEGSAKTPGTQKINTWGGIACEVDTVDEISTKACWSEEESRISAEGRWSKAGGLSVWSGSAQAFARR